MTPVSYAVIQDGKLILSCNTARAARWVAVRTDADVEPLYRGGQELHDALNEAVAALLSCQINAIKAARYDRKWEGVSESLQPTIDRARAALNGIGGQL